MKNLWKIMLKDFQKDFPEDFNLWFIQLNYVSSDKKEKKLILSLPNISTLLMFNQRFGDLLQKRWPTYTKDFDSKIELIVDQSNTPLFNESSTEIPKKKTSFSQKNFDSYIPDLNSKFTFDRFVESSSTDIAFKAAQLIAKQKDPDFQRFNPFFIYGGVGLGKTHIIQAIGNYISEHTKSLKVIYVTAEKYMNDYIEAAITKNFKAFREFYRESNVLLIDDVQFLENKEKIQDEIFNNFNKLYQSNQQIVFTCDKHPKDLKNVQERLINRFSWGLTVDVKPPDFETRQSILEKKLKEIGIIQSVSPEIIKFLAENITQNIRDIESAVTKIDSILLLTNTPLSISLLENELQYLLTPSKIQSKGVTIFDIQNVISEHYHVSIMDLKSKKKAHHISFPRHMAIYIAKQILFISLSKIGDEFGNRDHSTILSSIKKIDSEMKTILSVRNDYEEILKKLT